MNEKEITLIISASILLLLFIVSFINKKIFRVDNDNKHLKTYDEDFELYFYKRRSKEEYEDDNINIAPKSVIEASETDLIENDTDTSETPQNAAEALNDIIEPVKTETNFLTDFFSKKKNKNLTFLHIYNLADLENSKDFSIYEKRFIENKLKNLISSPYDDLFIIIEKKSEKVIKEIYLNSGVNKERDILNQIQKNIVVDGKYTVIYIGFFGILKNDISEVIDVV